MYILQYFYIVRNNYLLFFIEGDEIGEESDYTDNALENLMRAAQQK